jgi:phosphoglucosamine mutase
LKFGTDGVRGVANAELTPELVLALGRAAARVLHGGTFLVGRDTRRSGPLLEAALTAGLTSEGADVVLLGVIPTPGVACLSQAHDLPAAVISASHNPFQDNGVKLFARGGRKLSDEVEKQLEAELSRTGEPVMGAGVGTVRQEPEMVDWYERQVAASLEGRRLDGLRVVIDCANGAASRVAPDVLRSLGADVEVLSAEPDGSNINANCGSTYPDALQRAVVASGADAGLAFDGDADRVVAVDAKGTLVDGDQLIALFALDLRERGLLNGDTVVVTVMTNLGFRLAMVDHGIAVHETKVGDRYVLEALEAGRWSLGGEQSGHIIFRDIATTGDGLLTGVQLLDLLRRSGRPLAQLAAGAMERLPQVLINVRVADRDGLAKADAVWAAVKQTEGELGDHGRVLLRPSGTEPLIRVMVEAPTEDAARSAAEGLAGVVQTALGR